MDLPGSIKATAPRLSTPAVNIVPEWFPEYSSDVPKYGYDMDSIVSVHQLVSNAIILDGQETDDAE